MKWHETKIKAKLFQMLYHPNDNKGPFPVPNGSQTVWRFAWTEEDWRFILLVERKTAPIVCYKNILVFLPWTVSD